MSTYPKPDQVFQHDVAEFLDARFDEAQRTCHETVHKHPELRYLAHYSQGAWNFSYTATEISDHERTLTQRLGRQLAFTVSALDRRLEPVGTGALIRVILHTERGAVVCESVVPRQIVVGLCFDTSAIRQPTRSLAESPHVLAADRAVSELTTEMRHRISLPSVNPGGWASADVVTALTSTEPRIEPTVEVPAEAADPGIVAACAEAVRHEDLQFVAYCTDGQVMVHADQFGHTSLAPFFTQVSESVRRAFYVTFSQELGGLVTRLNHTLCSGGPGGLLVRLVLDVEQGAIYFYRLGVGTYLVGVTIDQSRVRTADQRIARLALRIATGQPS